MSIPSDPERSYAGIGAGRFPSLVAELEIAVADFEFVLLSRLPGGTHYRHSELVAIVSNDKRLGGVMPTANEDRRLAAECLELAAQALPDFRGIYIGLAQGWTNLADHVKGRPAGDIAPDDQE